MFAPVPVPVSLKPKPLTPPPLLLLIFTFPLFRRPRRSSSAAFRRSMTLSSSSSSSPRMFQLQVDPLTGKSEWLIIHDQDQDEYTHTHPISTPPALLASTSYLDMLNDTHRNSAFRRAIHNTLTLASPPCHVLDIGAGTGFLSMLAARAMSLSPSASASEEISMVTACESYLPMFKLMRKVLRANNMDSKIHILNKRSDDLRLGIDVPSRAHMLVTEILDSELLGEGLIPTLQHAHDKLLVENPKTVPYRATTFAQLVECTYLGKIHDLVNREAEASDGIHLVPGGMAGILGIKQKQYAMHCNALKDEIKLLSEPFEVFNFDFWRRPDSFRETELQIKAINDGTVHAIISWWLLQLDSEGTIFYSTGPNWINCPDVKGPRKWCDHWKQSVWFTPIWPVFKNEYVQLHAMHSETSISYELKASQDNKEVSHCDPCTQDCQIILSPESIALYGDSDWRCSILNAIKNALHQTQVAFCVVADDSIFLTVAIASLFKSSHVVAFFPGLGMKVLRYLQKVSNANSYCMDHIEIVKDRDLQSTMQNSNQRKIDLFVAEPFYHGNDNALPWQNLRFWKERTLLDTFLSEDAIVMPCRGLLKACAMYLPDLWRSRCCLKEIEGFDHSVVNTTLGGCGGLPRGKSGPFLPCIIWQCGETEILSEMTTILVLDFSKPIGACSEKTQVQFRKSGICHGFVLWIDWAMDAKDNYVLSTGPEKRHWKQAVKLLNESMEVRDGESTMIEAVFNPSTGELTLDHAFLA